MIDRNEEQLNPTPENTANVTENETENTAAQKDMPTPEAEPAPQADPAPQAEPQPPREEAASFGQGSFYAPYGQMPDPRPPKNKKTVGWIVALVLLYVVLAGAVIALIASGSLKLNVGQAQNGTATEETKSEEEKTTQNNAPIVENPSTDGNNPIVGDNYTGQILSYASLYEQCVPSVVFVQANYRNGYSTGSGFVIDSENGYILTNHHVVEDSDDLSVTFYNGDCYTATLVGGDAINDVAVLRVKAEGKTLPHVTVGNSDNLKIGDALLVLGNPLGDLTFTLTSGIVSGTDRSINTGEYTIKTFQTDAAINSGNSGGPAFDATGAVVGIASAKYAATGVEGIGFCIPINDAMRIARDLVNYGYVKGRPNFGITVSDSLGYEYTTDEYGRRVMVETARGARIEQVGTDCCASRAGLQAGDIITKIDDKKIQSASDLINTKNNRYKAGDTVTLEVYRNGRTITVTVVFDEYTP